MIDILRYKSIVFDCDGVILNSNHIKTNAFYQSVLGYGEEAANQFAEYHVKHGGISRYEKFKYFLTDILRESEVDEGELKVLLDNYARIVRKELASCEVSAHLSELKRLTLASSWMVVSGGDEEELRSIFQSRGLGSMFDKGIYGSPDTKDEILRREIMKGSIEFPAIFLGDSEYDMKASKRAGLDFAFISNWSESSFDFEGADFIFEDLRLNE